MGGVVNAPKNKKAKSETFWTEALVKQFKWKYNNKTGV